MSFDKGRSVLTLIYNKSLRVYVLFMPNDKVQKNVKIDREDAQWLENHPQVNFSAVCRQALKDEIKMREQYDDSSSSQDERTI